eukprot:TRINITY_DN15017_c0_g1_i1.p1 TRINITY_DN15017_c0_g1~~TRINITY_DN15017_c0_g1_i1.p1  ORF type:complete len:1553 (+),score=278.20 TRINITY_DN15017_c0_g1_i1:434-4660(+)
MAHTVRATIGLVESLRRFAGALGRRSLDEAPANGQLNAFHGGSNAGGQMPGPHPDEGLYSTGQLPFSDILHPMAVQLPLPIHKVGYEARPQMPPHRWLRRNAAAPWASATRFVKCCLSRGLKPDGAVISRALPALPPEARRWVQHLFADVVADVGSEKQSSSLDGNGHDTQPSWNDARTSPTTQNLKMGLMMSNGTTNGLERQRREDSKPSFGLQARSGEPEELSAAISFAQDIRHLRNRTPSAEGVPPLDIAAALGVRNDAPVSPRRDYLPPSGKAFQTGSGGGKGMPNGHHAVAADPQQRLEAAPGEPSIWLTLSAGGHAGSALGPVPVGALQFSLCCLSWTYHDQIAAKSTKSRLALRDLLGGPRFEASGDGGTSVAMRIAELGLGAVLENVTAEVEAAEKGHGASNGSINGVGGHARRDTLTLHFAKPEQAEQFAGMLNSSLPVDWDGHHEDVEGSEDMAQYLRNGPWDASFVYSSAQDLPMQPLPLPTVRVVILGAPLVGKTSVARTILQDLAMRDAEAARFAEEDPACLRCIPAAWPKAGKTRAEVAIWDGSGAPTPTLMHKLLGDGQAAVLAVVVCDAVLCKLGAPASSLVASCLAEMSSVPSAAAPRRLFVVDNVFAGSGVAQAPLSKVSPKHYNMSCDLANGANCRDLCNAFSVVFSELVGEVESKSASTKSPPAPLVPASETGGWSSLMSIRPLIATKGGSQGIDRSLARFLSGDSALLDPAAAAWAWSATKAAYYSFADGCNVSVGDALLPLDRLERALNVADSSAPVPSPSATMLLVRTLADLGMVCPIPQVVTASEGEMARTQVGCSWVLLPDFARRVRLSSKSAETLLAGGGGSSSSTSTPSSPIPTAVGREDKADGRHISARLLWEATGSQPLQLRSALRNFLARGTLGNPTGGGVPAKSIHLRRFVLLDSGPAGAATATSDPLSPGFALLFDLAPVMQTSAGGAYDDVGSHPGAKPPGSMPHATPSGAGVAPVAGAAGAAAPVSPSYDDDIFAAVATQGLTALVVGVSSGGSSSSSTASASSKDISPSYWDVYCSGPHAQWAWRTFLGTAGGSLGFSGFRKQSQKAGNRPAAETAADLWPLPPPACILSDKQTSSPARSAGAEGGLSGKDLVNCCWLLNGPQAGPARASLLPASSGPSGPAAAPSGIAACCAAVLGKKPPRALEDEALLPAIRPQDCGSEALVSSADFDVALAARNWAAIPKLFSSALASGVEPWMLCSATLGRQARDCAGASAGLRGRALPIMYQLPDAGQSGNATGSQAEPASTCLIGLVPEGPEPVTLGAIASTGISLGSVRASPGVQAWLRVSRPSALWAAAGASRGFINPQRAPQLPAPRGEELAEAVQSALAVQMTEQMVSEVWDALGELEASKSLLRRACGSWVQVSRPGPGFIL